MLEEQVQWHFLQSFPVCHVICYNHIAWVNVLIYRLLTLITPSTIGIFLDSPWHQPVFCITWSVVVSQDYYRLGNKLGGPSSSMCRAINLVTGVRPWGDGSPDRESSCVMAR